MSEETQETGKVYSTLKERLDTADLNLKKTQRWVAFFAIISGIITVINAYSAIKLSQAQSTLAVTQVFEQQQNGV